MAYSSYGKKVYASIKDLPQYTSIGNGDKIIIWNEARDGAATVDFADLMIDLDHVTFKSTVNEIVTLASDIQSFVHTVNEEIEGLQETVSVLETTINKELKARIRALEYIVAIMLGSNSYWLTSTGLENIRNKILIEGISQSGAPEIDNAENAESREALKWYYGLMSVVQGYISKLTPGVTDEQILLQSKFRYKYSDVNINPVNNSSGSASVSAPLNISSTTTTYEITDGAETPTAKTVTEITQS